VVKVYLDEIAVKVAGELHSLWYLQESAFIKIILVLAKGHDIHIKNLSNSLLKSQGKVKLISRGFILGLRATGLTGQHDLPLARCIMHCVILIVKPWDGIASSVAALCYKKLACIVSPAPIQQHTACQLD
jgi:hypothetical protein